MYDLAIIGGGPAGLSAAIYAARYKLNAVIISKTIGGIVLETHKIENWPGEISITGAELMKKFEEHIKAFKIETKSEEVKGIKKKDDHFMINDVIEAKKVLLSLGSERRKLDIPRESEFMGRGVTYCFTCDAPFYGDKIVAVVGGSDAAFRAAQLLVEYATRVYIIYRKDKFFRVEPALMDEVLNNPKVETIMKANVKELHGKDFLEGITLDTGQKVDVEGLFIEIGSMPSTSLAKELGVKLSEQGYIEVDGGMRTNVSGVYAAGDVTTGSGKFRQIVTAASEGAIAAASAFQDL